MTGLVAKMFIWQLAVTTLFAAAFFFVSGEMHAFAALVGGGIAIVSSMYFAARTLAVPRDAGPDRMLAALMRGQVMKWLLALVMFVFAAMHLGEQFLALILTYMANTSVYWVALLWLPVQRGN